jgi:microcystin-dependent protein
MWYDTTSNILKIRSEANDAWISIGYLDQSAQRFEPENAVPTGAVNTFAMNSAPTGWLSCDGSLISRTTYSGLFSVVGTLYGVGDGSTTFNLPDLRGEFIRGFDAGRGVDSGRVFGTSQLDQMQRLTGGYNTSSEHFNVGSGVGVFTDTAVNTARNAGLGYNSATRLDFDSADSPNARVSSTTSGETRSRNVALLYCIKY